MQIFHLLLLVPAFIPTLLVSAAGTCNDCVNADSTFCRISATDGVCVDDFSTINSFSFADCSDVDGGTFETPAVTTKSGCDYFEDPTIGCEACVAQVGCEYCEAYDGGQSGCLCDAGLSCSDVAWSAAIYSTASDCTFWEDAVGAYNKTVNRAFGIWIAIIVTPIVITLLCLCACVYVFVSKRNRENEQDPHVTTVHTKETTVVVHEQAVQNVEVEQPEKAQE